MNLTTFTIESVHGIKQTFTLGSFTVGPPPKSLAKSLAPATVASPEAALTTAAGEPRQ